MVTKRKRGSTVTVLAPVPEPVYPPAINRAALLLNIGAGFALTLAEAGRLPGILIKDGEYLLDMRQLNEAIYLLPQQIHDAQRSRVSQELISPVVEAPALEDYADWMLSRHYCGACNHDGVHNQMAYSVRCYGYEPRAKRS